jgi:3-oxoacyl-[acyl-carrier-protein] synthase II
MDLYITGAGIISAAGDNSNGTFLKEAPEYSTDHLPGQEPDYTGYIAPMQLRRMSKAVRMGIGASKIALQESGVEKPDAISIGTALGCLQDTETFLSKMVEQNEQMLSPTAFIQSTHNTVGGQIALLTGCYGHNLTYTHRGHSFEQAMIDAQLHLDEHPQEKMLVGGIDELTGSSLAVLKATGVYSKEKSTEQILEQTKKGSVAGEGAAFFTVSKNSDKALLQVKDISIFTARNAETAIRKLSAFMDRSGLKPDEIDLFMSGWNGDERVKLFYEQVHEMFGGTAIAGYKHLSGEYATASSFALGLIAEIAKKGNVPEYLLLNRKKPGNLKRVLLVDHYMHYYRLWWVELV